MSETFPTPISEEIATLHTYLQDRSIPLDPEYLDTHGIELAGGQRISHVLGAPYPKALGLVLHYPGTDYSTVRLVPGGPRCPAKRTPHAWLCPETDWNTVAGTIVICESPLKAMCWAMHGYNAMAAGGVTTVYMPRRDQWCVGFPHAAIDQGAVHTALIAWDSDIDDNHNVAQAMRVLTRALSTRHPELTVQVHRLPKPPELVGKDDWGCDDARAYHGADWFEAWCASTDARREPERDLLQDQLDDLSETYIACLMPERVIHRETGRMHTDNVFKNFVEAHRSVPGEKKPTRVAPVWLAHPDRPTVEGIVYAPGAPAIRGVEYNLWRSSPLIPRAGDVSPWLDLINDAVRDEETRRRMLECMAFQVQNRGQRLGKLLYFVGRQVGTGKSTQAAIMQRILGDDNTGWITRADLEGPYSACWAAKELVVLDDVEKLKRDTWAKIKNAITSDNITVTEKYLPARQQRNYCTFYVSANQADILSTDPDERRVLMIPFEPTRLHRGDDDPYWPGFHHWLNTGGVEAIAHYLGSYDMTGFNPNFYPPRCEAKEEALAATMRPEQEFMEDFIADPASFGVPRDRLCVTGNELYTMMTGEACTSFNTYGRQQLSRMISSRLYLRRHSARMVISGERTYIYWLPGKEPQKVAERNWFKRHLNKFPIKLKE